MIQIYYYEDTSQFYLFEADHALSRGPFGKDAVPGSQYCCPGVLPDMDHTKWHRTNRESFDYRRCVRVCDMLPDARSSLSKLYNKLATI